MQHRTGETTERTHLHALRVAAGWTQDDVARLVNAAAKTNSVTGDMVGRWERGEVGPSPRYRRALAEVFGVTVADLEITPRTAPTQVRGVERFLMNAPGLVDGRVLHDQQQWRNTRHALNGNRLALAKVAADVYPDTVRFGDTGLIAGPDWIPAGPIPLEAVTLTLDEHVGPPDLNGTERESAHTRPCETVTRPYPRYTKAVDDLDRPKLFSNRAAWRLTDLDWTADAGRMAFGPTSYFASVDVNEVLAHELAMVALDGDGRPTGRPPRLADLPYRRLLGDPFAFGRRPVMPAVSTLTIRGGDAPTFILHRRDSRSVAMAGDTLQVIPSGIFQPSSVLPAVAAGDFSLFANIAREYAEELLGYAEYDGNGQPIDYAAEPFGEITAARDAGRLRLWCLGVGLDALTLVGEILTVAVIDPDVFDLMARDFVEVNDEGSVVNERPAFDEATIDGLLASGRMAPAGAGCLALAWQHRDVLL